MRGVRDLVDSLPGWTRSRWALAPVLVLVLVPVLVSLLRAPDFETTLEVFPTKPPGNAVSSNEPDMPAPARVNLVSNPGFEQDRSGWADPPAFTARRSDAVAHSGSASLRASSGQEAPSDTNAGYTHVVFPRAGTYRARAWVYIPRRARAAYPDLRLEGFSGSRHLAQRAGDPDRRGTWQPVWSDYAISSRDLEGALVLRVPPDPSPQGAGETADREIVVYWDDITVSAPRPEPPRDARGPANSLRSSLEEPQLRFEVSLMAEDDRLYDPRRATVVRSPREDALSFIVRVRSDVPDDARRVGAPLRLALVRAGRRSRLRQTQAAWQNLISELGSGLPPGQRKLLQRRAEVLQRMIGAPARDAVALPSAAPEPSRAERVKQQRVQEDRQKVIARLGEHLAPRQRALLAQRVDDLQRMIASQTAEYVVIPAGRVAEPTRAVDRLLATLPGPFPPRVDPAAAGAAGLLCALLLFGLLVAVSVLRQRAAAHGG